MWPFGRRAQASREPAGRLGEKLAEKLLRQAGYRILARNYRCPGGEADLIALAPEGQAQGRTIAFVEVKTRASDCQVAPESAVDDHKRRQMVKVARYYLSCHDADDCQARFDVVAVVVEPGRHPRVRHTVGAFEPA